MAAWPTPPQAPAFLDPIVNICRQNPTPTSANQESGSIVGLEACGTYHQALNDLSGFRNTGIRIRRLKTFRDESQPRITELRGFQLTADNRLASSRSSGIESQATSNTSQRTLGTVL